MADYEVGREDPVTRDVASERIQGTGQTDVTINVPSDESTFADAMTAATEEVRPRTETNVVVNIESGHTLSDGVVLRNGHFGSITVTSEDAVVPVEATFTNDVLFLEHCIGPRWDVLVDMAGNGSDGIFMKNATVTVEDNKGATNAGERGIYSEASRIWATNADFTGATSHGATVTGGTVSFLQGSDLSGAGEDGVYISRASVLSGADLTVSDSGLSGIEARRSWVFCGSLTAHNCGSAGILGFDGMATIVATAADIQNPNSNGILARAGSDIYAGGATIDGAGSEAVRMEESSKVNLTGASLTNSTDRAIRVRDGGQVFAKGVTIDGAGGDGVIATDGARVQMTNATISNVTANHIEVLSGGFVFASGVQTDGTALATGETNLSSFNSITSDGLIFN